jgi:hypothetical protein
MNLRAWTNATFPAGPLALTRIGVAAAALVKCWIIAPILIGLSAADALRVPAMWSAYPPRTVIFLLIAVWVAAALGLGLGLAPRVSAAVLAGCVVTTFLLDQQLYSNNLYLLGLLVFLLALADSGAAWIIRGRRRRERVPAFPVFLLLAILPIVYGFAGLSKINPQWLSGGIVLGSLRDGFLALPAGLRTVEVMRGIAAITIVAEVVVALGLLVPRTRRIALAGGLALHAGMVLMLTGPLELFGFTLASASLYPLYWHLGEARVGEVPARDTSGSLPETRSSTAHGPTSLSDATQAAAVRR